MWEKLHQKKKKKKANKKKGSDYMSKALKVDKKFIEEAKNDFLKMIEEGKFTDGKIVFNRTFAGNTNKKAKLSIDELAWRKMKALVEEFDKEIAWHGIAKRGEGEGEYIINDIMVYPQTVTGATVTTDQEKYQMWLYEHDDEVFENIRMQGHSHVNMGVTPSGVDTTYYERIVEQMTDEMFYIFMILNKKGNRTVIIYDKRDNVVYETSDISVVLLIDPEDPINKLIEDAKEKVKDEPVVTKTNTYGNTYNFGYGTGYGNNYNYNGGTYKSGIYSGNAKKPVVNPSAIGGLTQSEYDDIMNNPFGYY